MKRERLPWQLTAEQLDSLRQQTVKLRSLCPRCARYTLPPDTRPGDEYLQLLTHHLARRHSRVGVEPESIAL